MGNGAMPNGPSYRAHPRLYHLSSDSAEKDVLHGRLYKKRPRWSGASLSHYGSLCLIAHAALNVGATLEEMHGRIFLSRLCLARFLLLGHLGSPLSSSICGKAESRNQKRS